MAWKDTSELRPHLEAVIDRLAKEFDGLFSRETIGRYVDESLGNWPDPAITTYIPILVERFAKIRLEALAQADGLALKAVPEVLFVCVRNAGRSQLAAAILEHHAAGKAHARTAGSAPSQSIDEAAIQALGEIGLDVGDEFPKPLTEELVRAADIVVTMGCGDSCPILPGKRYLDWDLPDPAGASTSQIRTLRDEIERRVLSLLEVLPNAAPPAGDAG